MSIFVFMVLVHCSMLFVIEILHQACNLWTTNHPFHQGTLIIKYTNCSSIRLHILIILLVCLILSHTGEWSVNLLIGKTAFLKLTEDIWMFNLKHFSILYEDWQPSGTMCVIQGKHPRCYFIKSICKHLEIKILSGFTPTLTTTPPSQSQLTSYWNWADDSCLSSIQW